MLTNEIHLHRHERMLALSIAFFILKLDPTHAVREELCGLFETQKEMLEIAAALRDTGIEATLRLMRAHYAARHHAGHA